MGCVFVCLSEHHGASVFEYKLRVYECVRHVYIYVSTSDCVQVSGWEYEAHGSRVCERVYCVQACEYVCVLERRTHGSCYLNRFRNRENLPGPSSLDRGRQIDTLYFFPGLPPLPTLSGTRDLTYTQKLKSHGVNRTLLKYWVVYRSRR